MENKDITPKALIFHHMQAIDHIEDLVIIYRNKGDTMIKASYSDMDTSNVVFFCEVLKAQAMEKAKG